MRQAFVFLFVSACLWSQVPTARLEGTVQDSTGAVIPAASVTALNTRTQVKITGTTDANGFYIFPTLQPGLYNLTVEAKGFRKAVVSAIEMNVGQTITERVTLEVGQVSDSVVVEATTVKVNTTDATIARSVTMKDIDTLPQLARNPIALATFQPGVQINPGDASFSRVNGMRQGANNTTLDGIDTNDAVLPRLGLALTTNNVDSVEEFRIITNGAKAEYGRNAGGQVELITRSGTNQWHGNAFSFHRNTVLNANQFFNNSSGQARPKIIQNTFGASLGGPIKRDKMFIFGNWQSVRTAQETVRNRTVPTLTMRQGIFRWNPPGGGATQSFNIFQNDPRRIGIDPEVAKILPLMPAPNNTDVGDQLNLAGFRFNNPTPSRGNQFTIKSDWNITSTNRLWFRYTWSNNTSFDALNGVDSTFPGQPTGTQGGVRSGYAIGSNWTIKPWLVNEFIFGIQEASVVFFRPRQPNAMMISNSWTDPLLTATSSERNSPVTQFTENLTILKGKHTFKTGARIPLTLQYQSSDAGIFPNVTFARASGNIPGNIGPSGAIISSADRQRFENLYNDLLGRVDQIATTFYADTAKFQPTGTPRVRNFQFYDYSFFFQDDWRISKTLTLNLGLRWEYFGRPKERDRLQGIFTQANLINRASNLDNLTVARSTEYYAKDMNNFAPRFGFAWSPGGAGKMSIRGSYGIFYDRLIGATATDVDAATPGFSQGVTVFPNQTGSTDIRWGTDKPAVPVPPAAPQLTIPVANRINSVALFDPNIRTPYVHQINFTIQREVFRNTVVEVGYVGNRGVKLLQDVNLNQRRIGGVFLNDFRQMQAFVNSATAVPPATNLFVRMFGTPAAAVTAIGAATFRDGLAGTAADTVDRNNNQRYAAAGLSQFFIRPFPQFNLVTVADNSGRSYYNSMQLSLRRNAGALRFAVNYTWSKVIDTVSVDGSGFTRPIDNNNLILNRGLADYDRTHTMNWTATYNLPIGKGKFIGRGMADWADKIVGGWEIGTLGVWTSGPVMTVSSGRQTAGVDANTWANYNGSRSIGSVQRQGNGVIWWTPEQVAQFTFPGAGEIGTSGRNSFRGPRFFNTDLSLVKRFRLATESRRDVTFRAEAYNLFNNVNFAAPGLSLATPQSLGRISGITGNARIMQGALRFDF